VEPESVGLELSVWKYVVIIGAVAVIAIYVLKRISDVVVSKKTNDMIKRVVGDDLKQGETAADTTESSSPSEAGTPAEEASLREKPKE